MHDSIDLDHSFQKNKTQSFGFHVYFLTFWEIKFIHFFNTKTLILLPCLCVKYSAGTRKC